MKRRPAGMTAAIYARVSTQDQKVDMQLTEVRAFAKRMDWEVVEYLEKASSVKRRPVFERMMSDARQRKFDVVLVWKMDRLARSMKQFIDTILELDSKGIRFIAVTQGIDTDKQNPMGKFLMHIMAAFGELERGMIVERVRAGVAEAQRQGKHCGRPPAIFRRDEVVDMRQAGYSWRYIARLLSMPQSTIRGSVRKVYPTCR